MPTLQEYDMVVWLDGSIEITDEHTVTKLRDMMYCQNPTKAPLGAWLWRPTPNKTHTLADEVQGSKTVGRYETEMLLGKKQPYQHVADQWKFYKQQGFPATQHRVYLTCFVVWDMHHAKARPLLDRWFLQNLLWTTQDQIGLPYAVWKEGGFRSLVHQMPNDQINGSPFSKTDLYVKHGHLK